MARLCLLVLGYGKCWMMLKDTHKLRGFQFLFFVFKTKKTLAKLCSHLCFEPKQNQNPARQTPNPAAPCLMFKGVEGPYFPALLPTALFFLGLVPLPVCSSPQQISQGSDTSNISAPPLQPRFYFHNLTHGVSGPSCRDSPANMQQRFLTMEGSSTTP